MKKFSGNGIIAMKKSLKRFVWFCVIMAIFGIIVIDNDAAQASKIEALRFDDNHDGKISNAETIAALIAWGLNGEQMIKVVDDAKRSAYLNSQTDHHSAHAIAKQAKAWLETYHTDINDQKILLKKSFYAVADKDDDQLISVSEAVEACRFGEYEPIALKQAADAAKLD